MKNMLNLITKPLEAILLDIRDFFPNLIAMFIVFLLGFLLAWLTKFLFHKFLKAVKFDNWSDRMGLTAAMRKGDLWSKPSIALSRVLFWFLIVITVMAGLNALDYEALDNLIKSFFNYLPRIFSALIILLIGYLVSSFISRAILIASANAGYHYARILAEAARVLLMLMILAMAMEQLQIAPGIVLSAFSILFGGIVAALSISFGVGGIDAARRVIEKESKENRSKHRKEDIEHL
jgi:hypothetical protein